MPLAVCPLQGNRCRFLRHGILSVALGLIACAGLPTTPQPHWSSPAKAKLLDGSLLGLSGLPEQASVDILSLDDSMRRFADRFRDTASRRDNRTPVERLLLSLQRDEAFQVRYAANRTLTASQTFHAGTGNCLSFTTMVVALAREMGLRAYFQLVDVPQIAEQQEDLLLIYRHVNAEVRTLAGARYEVDFNAPYARSPYPRRIITDQQALALYYNNLAAEALVAGDNPTALSMLKAAIDRAPELAPPWVNLGVLYRRTGNPAAAEAAYLQALGTEHGDRSARDNLAALYAQYGVDRRARPLRQQLNREAENDPYAQYERGLMALGAGRYDLAAQSFNRAVRKNAEIAHFHAGLGRAQIGLNDPLAARQSLIRALVLGADPESMQEWKALLEGLLQGSAHTEPR